MNLTKFIQNGIITQTAVDEILAGQQAGATRKTSLKCYAVFLEYDEHTHFPGPDRTLPDAIQLHAEKMVIYLTRGTIPKVIVKEVLDTAVLDAGPKH